jgi:hypothetical protein
MHQAMTRIVNDWCFAFHYWRQHVVNCESCCCGTRKALLRMAQSTTADGTQYRERVEALEEELSRCKTQYQKLEEKMQSMIETPQGLRNRAHGIRMKSPDELATSSGYLKRRRALLRVQLAPSIVTKVQHQNRQNGKKRRLTGDSSAQRRTAEYVASILSQGRW